MQILPPLAAVLRGGFSFGEVRVLTKPPNIANDPFKSAKWDELTAGRGFTASDAPRPRALTPSHQPRDTPAPDIFSEGAKSDRTAPGKKRLYARGVASRDGRGTPPCSRVRWKEIKRFLLSFYLLFLPTDIQESR